MSKRKQGENEAIAILENLGVEIDKEYCDDNSQRSMPDIRRKDGRYIEVTHTIHNNSITKGVRKFDRIRPGEDAKTYIKRHLKVENECHFAIKRVNKLDYEENENGQLTTDGKLKYEKDLKLIKDHLGYDLAESDLSKQHSEFKCDHPTMIFSTNNILREITEDKGRKYPDGNVDLFIFAATEEFRLIKELISQRAWNGVAISFLNQIVFSPFQKIYVCEWCLEKLEYNTDAPQLVVFEKYGEGVKWKWNNLKEHD